MKGWLWNCDGHGAAQESSLSGPGPRDGLEFPSFQLGLHETTGVINWDEVVELTSARGGDSCEVTCRGRETDVKIGAAGATVEETFDP